MAAVYTAAEVAELLRCSRDSVYRMVDAGQLHAIRIGRGNNRSGIRITDVALAEFLSAVPS